MHGPESEYLPDVTGVDGPGAVGEGGAIVLDRPGEVEDCRDGRIASRVPGQESRNGIGRRGIIGDLGALDGTDLPLVEERKTCVGAADIGEQDTFNPGHCLSAILSVEGPAI
jgi:hypothetical protein